MSRRESVRGIYDALERPRLRISAQSLELRTCASQTALSARHVASVTSGGSSDDGLMAFQRIFTLN